MASSRFVPPWGVSSPTRLASSPPWLPGRASIQSRAVRAKATTLTRSSGQLRPEDRVSVVAFARTARLWIDALPGNQGGELAKRVGELTPQGGTNLEEAMNLAYKTALS